jgi:hypothetical protein
MEMLVSAERVNSGHLKQPHVQLATLADTAIQQTQLKQIFTDLHEFEVGELSRLCISKDYFPTIGNVKE